MLPSSYKGHEQERGLSQDRLVGPETHHLCGVGSPWLGFQGVLRHGWAGRLCFRPSSSSEPLSWGRVRAEASELITALCLAVAQSRLKGHQVSLMELEAGRVEVFSGKQGLNIGILQKKKQLLLSSSSVKANDLQLPFSSILMSYSLFP